MSGVCSFLHSLSSLDLADAALLVGMESHRSKSNQRQQDKQRKKLVKGKGPKACVCVGVGQ